MSYTWLDAEYGEFRRNSGGVSSLARAGNCRLTQVSGDDLCELDNLTIPRTFGVRLSHKF